jgi:hypothetical protein
MLLRSRTHGGAEYMVETELIIRRSAAPAPKKSELTGLD